jgi:hypothetical protein
MVIAVITDDEETKARLYLEQVVAGVAALEEE